MAIKLIISNWYTNVLTKQPGYLWVKLGNYNTLSNSIAISARNILGKNMGIIPFLNIFAECKIEKKSIVTAVERLSIENLILMKSVLMDM